MICTPKMNAAAASSRPSRLASRSGATENEVSPSIERPISEYRFQVVRPWIRRLVVDPDLAEADPAGEPLEEPIALGELLERGGGTRREQAEVAGVLGNLLPGAPVDEHVECLDAETAKPRLSFAVSLGGINHVVAVIEPMPDKLLHQGGRMLTVAIHEQDTAPTRVIETGEQRRLLAEIARQRDDLNIKTIGS
jgi:hypothetical protein